MVDWSSHILDEEDRDEYFQLLTTQNADSWARYDAYIVLNLHRRVGGKLPKRWTQKRLEKLGADLIHTLRLKGP